MYLILRAFKLAFMDRSPSIILHSSCILRALVKKNLSSRVKLKCKVPLSFYILVNTMNDDFNSALVQFNILVFFAVTIGRENLKSKRQQINVERMGYLHIFLR